METITIEDSNPFYKKDLPINPETNLEKISFMKASFFDFEFGSGS